MKTATQSPAFRAREILRDAHCKLINACDGPKGSELEFWAVPSKGVLMMQIYSWGGVDTYANWTLGANLDDLSDHLT